MTNRLSLILLSCLTTLGCAAKWQPLDAMALKTSAPRSVSLLLEESPNLFLGSYGGLGLAGAIAGDIHGQAIMKGHKLIDPAKGMRTELLSEISQFYGLEVRSSSLPPRTVDMKPSANERGSRKTLPRDWGDADVMLNVRTSGWAITNYPTWIGHFRVIYSAQIQLLDRRLDHKVVADGSCDYRSSFEEETAPSLEKLEANDAAIIKAELATAVSQCMAKFRSLLGLAAPSSPNTAVAAPTAPATTGPAAPVATPSSQVPVAVPPSTTAPTAAPSVTDSR